MYNTCPSFDTLARFAEAALADHEAAKIVTHLAACETCSRKADELEHRSEQPMLAALRNLQNEPIVNADPPLPKTIGQYEILEKIGQGGMGTVYRAIQPHLERDVAIKVVKESRLTDPATRERFKREIQAVGKLRHPNIVQAHDAGFIDDKPYLVMEFLHGIDLGEHVKRYGKLAVETASDYIRQAALGLQHAHEAGIVHRDVKPSNLLLTDDGTVKILDLGLATLLDAEENSISWRNIDPDATKTWTGHIIGTLDFLSPEQALGLKADHQSDIYSLGCTFYFLLSGKPPFDDDRYSSAPDKLAGHIRDDLPKLSLPKRIDTALKKMAAKSSANRFTTATDVAAALIPPRHIVRNAALAVFFVAAIILATFFLARQDDGAEPFFNNGARLLEQEEYPAAIREFTEAIRRRPTFIEAYSQRAECFEEISDNESAIADHTEVIRRQPDRAYAYFNRGSCLARLGKYDDALLDFDESIRLDPTSFMTFNNRAETYRRQGRLDLAIKDIDKALRLQPKSAMLYNNRGAIHRDRGDLQSALTDFSEAIHYDPTLAPSYNNRGFTYINLDEPAKALVDLDKAIELNPREAMAFYNRGLSKIKLGKFAEAIEDLDEALRLDPKLALAYNNRGFAKIDLGNLDEALEDLNKAMELDPNLAIAHQNKGLALLQKDDFAGAVRSSSEAIRLAPDLPEPYFIRGSANIQIGKPDLAVVDLTRSLDSPTAVPPFSIMAHQARADAYTALGETEKAAADTAKAEELQKLLANPDDSGQ